MKKDVMIFIKDVKYYQDQQSLVIVGVEVETRRPINQQITVKAFLEGSLMFNTEEIQYIVADPDRCRFFASQLKARQEPFRLEFEDTKTPEDEI